MAKYSAETTAGQALLQGTSFAPTMSVFQNRTFLHLVRLHSHVSFNVTLSLILRWLTSPLIDLCVPHGFDFASSFFEFVHLPLSDDVDFKAINPIVLSGLAGDNVSVRADRGAMLVQLTQAFTEQSLQLAGLSTLLSLPTGPSHSSISPSRSRTSKKASLYSLSAWWDYFFLA